MRYYTFKISYFPVPAIVLAMSCTWPCALNASLCWCSWNLIPVRPAVLMNRSAQLFRHFSSQLVNDLVRKLCTHGSKHLSTRFKYILCNFWMEYVMWDCKNLQSKSVLLNNLLPENRFQSIFLDSKREFWRRDPESNWTRRICNPLHRGFTPAPTIKKSRNLPVFLFGPVENNP